MEKRVLIIGPQNNGYLSDIANELVKRNCVVHVYDERNNPGFLEKALYRKVPSVLQKKSKRYFSKIVKTEKIFNPDCILFISPETIDDDIFSQLREAFQKTFFILYMWDSVQNKNKKIAQMYRRFDRVLSFDTIDCQQYGYDFRPLFFPSYCLKKSNNDVLSYDISFIGTAHSDRAKILSFLLEECQNKKLSSFLYLFAQGRIMFIKNYISDKYFRKLTKIGVTHYKSMEKSKVYDIMAKTNCVVDINHPKQTGLTMRTIETLGFNGKLMTTNKHILEYDFYSDDMIKVFSRDKPLIDYSFVSNRLVPIDLSITNRYSLEAWITDVFKGVIE